MRTTIRASLLSYLAVLVYLAGSFPAPGVEGSAFRDTQVPDSYHLDYTLDRSAVPALSFDDLTLLIYVGRIDAVEVSGDGSSAYHYEPASGMVRVTTTGSRLRLTLHNPASLNNVGRFSKAVLKDDKAWAWSHSFDDNVNLNAAIDVMEAHGWRGTLFMIGKDIPDRAGSDWTVTAPHLRELLAAGWSVGNHTWDHACTEENITRQTILDGYDRLQGIVESSAVPDYRLIAFAAPCFKTAYQPLIAEMVANGETAVRYNESGNAYRLVVDPGAVSFVDRDTYRRVTAFDTTLPIGRDGSLSSDLPRVIGEIDWLAAQASPTRHLWYNTFSHGNAEAALQALAGHVYQTYGPGGSDEVWVAPSDQIYSYFLVRDFTTISFSGSPAGTVVDAALEPALFLPLLARP